MNRTTSRLAVCTLCVAFLAARPGALGAQAAAPFPMGWLTGCWTLTAGPRVVEETWNIPRGGAMLGTSRTVNNGRMTETEFVTLVHAGDSLQYRVRAGKQAEVTFTARAPFADEIIFENLQHDFPKRVGYKRVTKDSVEGWIDGGAAAAGRRIAFGYHRQACVAP